MDCMESDLNKIILSGNELKENDIKYFMYSIMSGINFMHNSGVIQ
jgi:serine/threonine protein kinase